MTRVATDPTVVAYDDETGRLTVEAATAGDADEPLASGTVGVRLADAAGAESASAALDVDVSLSAVDAGLDDSDHGAVDVTVAVENRSTEPIRLQAIDVLDGATPFGPTDRAFVHGYQSWTPTATLRLDESFPEEKPADRPQMVDLAAPRDATTSHAVTALSGDPGRLALGFLEHDAYLTRFDLRADSERNGTSLTAVCPLDGVELAPGDRRESATLRIDAGRPVSDALTDLADAVGDRMDARVPESVPTGWCSWYHYFTDVTADDVRENAADLDDWGVDVDLVQIDDGYETAFGDWRTLAAGFDSMAELRADVEAAGYDPGLWLAPFYVQADSRLADEHPEWLVTEGGDPVDAGARHGPMYALDVTHPEVAAWLAETFETVVGEWGFEYLKLDFLYAAALPGDRHADVTRAEAYRRGLETVRDAVGDAFVLGCGAPGFPSVGLVDAMRVGPDTAPYWRRQGDSASQPAHENAVRNVLNRQFCHRRLWVNDPDCQLVRWTTELTAAERESFAALVALTGGSNFLSDAVSEIDEAGRRLFERTLPPVEDGRVDDFGARELPERVVCERDADGAVAVAAFNWSDESRRVRVDPAEYVDIDAGGDGLAWEAFAPADDARRLHAGPVEREIDPHGCLLVHCAPSTSDPRPVLVGAEHLANAAAQVTAVDWTDGTLSVSVDADEPTTLFASAPGTWRTDETCGDAALVELTAAPGPNEFEFPR
ncbi:glycoside hydrolase family 36 protein [Halobellus limi]|uniref:Alpha-galactosidase n=1 Tax=Halobellus limi TaxID=699433 RepID=A0A1H6BH28_9EURY|nr:glycoside hydrolase family 36 protein [Halobellus limi]QCC49038.1 alpha-galactosidase [Halobellus limi]SEG60058.1 alpha-galactosidase [Halobellus limi]